MFTNVIQALELPNENINNVKFYAKYAPIFGYIKNALYISRRNVKPKTMQI